MTSAALSRLVAVGFVRWATTPPEPPCNAILDVFSTKSSGGIESRERWIDPLDDFTPPPG